MPEESKEPKPGLALRLLGGMIGYAIVFGVLWPLGMWTFGDGKGFKTDLRDGLIQGAMVGILMALFGDALTRWIDQLLGRARGRKGK